MEIVWAVLISQNFNSADPRDRVQTWRASLRRHSDPTHNAMSTSSSPPPMDNLPSALHSHTYCWSPLSSRIIWYARNPPTHVRSKVAKAFLFLRRRVILHQLSTESSVHCPSEDTLSSLPESQHGNLTPTSGFT